LRFLWQAAPLVGERLRRTSRHRKLFATRLASMRSSAPEYCDLAKFDNHRLTDEPAQRLPTLVQ
jgi:hypothetical protein